MSTNRKPLEFKATKNGKVITGLRSRERRQKDVLFYVAKGQSIEQACNLSGVARADCCHGRSESASAARPEGGQSSAQSRHSRQFQHGSHRR